MDQKIKNIVFDVGMVLINFCWEKHCRNLGFDEDIIQAFGINMISSECWDMMDEGTIKEEDAIKEFIRTMTEYEDQIKEFWRHPEGLVEEYPYAAPMISELHKRGYKVYLLSNYPLNMYRIHWPTFTFYSMVDGYVVSAVERMKKPDPAIYRLLCKRYDLKPEECLFVDDRQVNVDAAMAVGMQSVLFEDYEHLAKYLEI